MQWSGWPIWRIVALLAAIEFIVIFIQVTLFHYRQNFRHWSMWIPVIATPVLGIFGLLYTWVPARWIVNLWGLLLVVGFVAGLFGTAMHIRGVGQRVGGYTLRNFMTGPPSMLPPVISATCLLGWIAVYWR